MIAALLFFAMSQAATVANPPAATPTPPVLPADWSTLPQLRLKRPTPLPPALSAFVHDEVKAGRCTATQSGPGGQKLHLDLAILLGDGGAVKRVVPRAINCPTVEQYASGLLLQIARDNVAPEVSASNSWYRTWFDFTWPQ